MYVYMYVYIHVQIHITEWCCSNTEFYSSSSPSSSLLLSKCYIQVSRNRDSC